MPDPNLPLLEDAVHKLAPFLDEIVFVGGRTTSRTRNVSAKPTSQKMKGKSLSLAGGTMVL